LEDLRQNNDIVEIVSGYLPLRQQGANFVGLCPFHREKSPSFSVSATRQLFHCFGCGEGGNVFSFIMKIENFSFLDAVKFLAERIGYRLPERTDGRAGTSASVDEKNRIYEIYKLAARFYYDNLQGPNGSAARAYLEHRKLAVNIQRKFGMGYASNSGLLELLKSQGHGGDENFLVKAGLVMEGSKGFYDRFRNRLMFPIFDVSGKVIGFGGRLIVEGEPKYLNSPETPVFDKSRTLYGLNFARLAKKRTMILVEGYMDVIALYQAGIKNTVAALGTALTPNHARILKRYCEDVVILFDSDEAGIKAVLRAIPHLYAAGLSIRVVQLSAAKDPDDYIQNFGVNALAQELRAATDFVDFQVKMAAKGVDMKETAQRVSFTKNAAAIIARLNTPVEREAYAKDMSAKYGMDEPSLKEQIKAILGGADNETFHIPHSTFHIAHHQAANNEAISHILWSMATSADLSHKISQYLRAEEFADPVYGQVFDYILQLRNQGKEPNVADILTALAQDLAHDDTAGQKAAAIFANPPEYAEIGDKYKALSDQVTLLKIAYLQYLKDQNPTDIELAQKLANERNTLQTHKISF
jgi:DNA primase